MKSKPGLVGIPDAQGWILFLFFDGQKDRTPRPSVVRLVAVATRESA